MKVFWQAQAEKLGFANTRKEEVAPRNGEKYFPGMWCTCTLLVDFFFFWWMLIFRYSNMRSGIIKNTKFSPKQTFLFTSLPRRRCSARLERLLFLYFPSTFFSIFFLRPCLRTRQAERETLAFLWAQLNNAPSLVSSNNGFLWALLPRRTPAVSFVIQANHRMQKPPHQSPFPWETMATEPLRWLLSLLN